MFLVAAFLYSYRLFERSLSITLRPTIIRTPVTNRLNYSSNLTNDTGPAYITTIVRTRYYNLIYNSFGWSDTALMLDFVNSIIMNCIAILGILLLNVLTLIKTKKSLSRKRALTTPTAVCRRASLIIQAEQQQQQIQLQLQQNGNSTTTTTSLQIVSSSNSKENSNNYSSSNGVGGGSSNSRSRSRHKISKAEMNISLMVFTSGIIAVLGHGLTFLYRLPFMAFKGNFCVYALTSFSFSLSYVLNFFIYLRFHKSFRRCFGSMFGSVVKVVFRSAIDSPTNSNTHLTIVHL